MSDPCRQSREDWLGRAASELTADQRGHAAACPACSEWLRMHGAIASALRALPRRAAPRDLEAKVAEWIEPRRDEYGEYEDSAVIRAVRGLGHVRAPDALLHSLEVGEYVDAADESLEEDPRFGQALRSLSRLSAPHVLERLVNEELAAPRRQLSERFPGDLERMRAPRSLDVRVARILRGANRPGIRRAALLLPAAALAMWIGARVWMTSAPSPLPPEPGSASEVRVVHVDGSSGIDALTRSLAMSPVPLDELGEEIGDARELLASWQRGEGVPPIEAPARVRRVLRTESAVDPARASGSPSPEELAPGGRREPAPSMRALAERIAQVGQRTSYAAVRRYHVFARPDERVRHLGYRELVVTDGTGAFDLDPFQVLTGTRQEEEVLLLLDLRAGYLFHHRDFAIRDVELFLANYELTPLPAREAVAGRSCRLYRVESRQPGRCTYEIAVDEHTGLVLRYLELDADGDVVAGMVYEHFVEHPDFTAVAFRAPLFEEEAAPAAEDEAAWRPRLVPDGYELRGTSVVTADGRRWLKRTYLDGVNPLVFLHAARSEEPAEAPGTGSDFIMVGRVGPAHTARARLRGHDLVAVGRVADDELVDLLESALP